jgi:hypothetical protein
MWERLLGSRNALVLRNAPATDEPFNVVRTALDLRFGFTVRFALRVAFPVALSGVVRPTALFAGACTVVDRLVRELVVRDLDAADGRDTADRVLT